MIIILFNLDILSVYFLVFFIMKREVKQKDLLLWIGIALSLLLFLFSFYASVTSSIAFGQNLSNHFLLLRIVLFSFVGVFFALLLSVLAGVLFSSHLHLYRQIFEHSNEAIAVLSVKGKYLLQNLAHKQLLQFDNDTLFRQESKYLVGDNIFKTIETLENLKDFSGEFKVKKADGSLVDVGLSCFTVKSELKEALFFVEFKRDITAIKKMEAQIKKDKEELARLSNIDSLTGLLNRNKFTRLVQYEIDQNERYNRDVSVVIFDIDFFKKVNDTFGHNAGDEVLKQVAMVAKQSLRTTDIIARWGGEEFLVFLPYANKQQAFDVGEKMRQNIAQKIISPTSVTCSFGVCQFQKGMDLTRLVGLADKALYFAKENGRNQVMMYEKIKEKMED